MIPAQPNNLYFRQVIECQGRDLEAVITLTHENSFNVNLKDLQSKNEVLFILQSQYDRDREFSLVQEALGLATSDQLGECAAMLNGLEEDNIFRTISSPFVDRIEQELSDILRHSALSDVSVSKTGAERALRGACDFDSGILRFGGTKVRFDLSREPDGKMSLAMEVLVGSNQTRS